MAIDTFRFVHATSLMLDHPVVVTGPLAGKERQLAEDASLQAFEHLIMACVDNQAAFLLLTGDTFDSRGLTLRACRTLENGLETLDEQNIPVYLVPGTTDPASAWRKQVKLPKNVTAFFEDDAQPAMITRDGKTLAAVFPVATVYSDETRWRGSGPAAFGKIRAPFRIGLVGAGCPVRWNGSKVESISEAGSSSAAQSLIQAAIDNQVDYLALGEGTTRATMKFRQGIAHDPGAPQARTPESVGSHGCSLVEVMRDGSSQIKLLCTGTVRYEDVKIDVPPDMKQEELVEKMALTLMEIEPQPSEELWLVRWILKGCGELFDSLANNRTQSELFDFVDHELSSNGGPRRQHRLLRKPEAISGAGESDEDTPHTLLLDYLEQVEQGLMPSIEAFRREAQTADWPSAPWAKHLRQAVQRLLPPSVAEQARIVGLGALM